MKQTDHRLVSVTCINNSETCYDVRLGDGCTGKKRQETELQVAELNMLKFYTKLPGRRKRRRFLHALKKDMQRLGVTKKDPDDRVRWNQIICCGVPTGTGLKKKKKKGIGILTSGS